MRVSEGSSSKVAVLGPVSGNRRFGTKMSDRIRVSADNYAGTNIEMRLRPYIRIATVLHFGKRDNMDPDVPVQCLPPGDWLHPYSRDPMQLGATVTDRGVNFSIVTGPEAKDVRVCLFDDTEKEKESRQLLLDNFINFQGKKIWYGFAAGVRSGQLYGYRVDGPYNPRLGFRYNQNKILIDPYARAVQLRPNQQAWNQAIAKAQQESQSSQDRDRLLAEAARLRGLKPWEVAAEFRRWDESFRGFGNGAEGNPQPCENIPSSLDSAPYAPLSVVIDQRVGRRKTARPSPNTDWRKTVVYELHTDGMTALYPLMPKNERGTFKGLGNPRIIKHLQDLGVTAVELMPVNFKKMWTVFQNPITGENLENQWGYDSLSYFALDPSYLVGGRKPEDGIAEFREMVENYHRAGIEVVLDIVFNHTGEGDENGETLSWRGFDNRYYRLTGEPDASKYHNDNGVGNSLDTCNPAVIKMVCDSLRYWVSEMGVDGFRFDLAANLTRKTDGQVEPMIGDHPLFKAMLSDDILKHAKLIVEPWDLGGQGQRQGHFPKPGVDNPNAFYEWNDRFRDSGRAFWHGDGGHKGTFQALLLSFDNIIKAITKHDGMTLWDLVSFYSKKNGLNGEGGKDGTDKNFSRAVGLEWPKESRLEDPGELEKLKAANPKKYLKIMRARRQRVKNMMVTMRLAKGPKMLLAGDEIGRTQMGNNNAVNQKFPLDWYNQDRELLEFSRKLAQLTKEHPVFTRVKEPLSLDAAFAQNSGYQDWEKAGALVYDGSFDPSMPSEKADDHFILLFNASTKNVDFKFKNLVQSLPEEVRNQPWELIFDTGRPEYRFNPFHKETGRLQADGDYVLWPDRAVLLRTPNLNRPRSSAADKRRTPVSVSVASPQDTEH